MNILICNIILITVWINMKGGGFGYYNPSKNLIEYGNKGWQIHDDRLQRRVTYTNLPPGDYVFEVKSVSTDLYSNQPYKNWGSVFCHQRGKLGGPIYYTVYLLCLCYILLGTIRL